MPRGCDPEGTCNGFALGVGLLAAGDFSQHDGVRGAIVDIHHADSIGQAIPPKISKETGISLGGSRSAGGNEAGLHSPYGGIVRGRKHVRRYLTKPSPVIDHPVGGRWANKGFYFGLPGYGRTHRWWQVGRIDKGLFDIRGVGYIPLLDVGQSHGEGTVTPYLRSQGIGRIGVCGEIKTPAGKSPSGVVVVLQSDSKLF